ncbi:MAG: hypothetical protein PHN51_12595 [Candidatus Nanopelagicales bacterium]|nr:hypothetical protein [Candidatus Nanopelagicales bacterium]
MTSIIARPVDALVLHQKGESKERLGPNARLTSYAHFKHLEELVIKHSLMPISADITPIHPPFFTEFTYTDIFGGFLVTTLSAEINYRLAESLGSSPSSKVSSHLTGYKDKYKQTDLPDNLPQLDKVIFMTGSNLFLRVVDTSRLDEMMATDNWYLKPHPLTNDQHMREYGTKYGYHRVIDKNVSGHALYERATEIGSLNSSELTIRAMLDGKPVVNLTNFAERYGHSYSCFIEAAKTRSDPSTAIRDMLSDEESGFLFPEFTDEENITRLHAYQKKALELREPFRMKTYQQLQVRRKNEPQPQQPPVRKQP